jgi:antitoxin PrlF
MSTSTLTSKGQTTIPQEVREALGLRPGMRIVFEVSGNTAVLRPHPGVMSLFGALKGPGDEKIDFKEARASALNTWATEAGEEGK